MTGFFHKIEESFEKANKGEEQISVIIWWWGILAYLFAFFIAEKLIKAIDVSAIDVAISLLTSLYFAWHIYVLRKCAPKKPKLTPEEKAKIKVEARNEIGKKFLRKLFLQEPISKGDPVLVTLVMDLFFIAHFLGYIAR